LALQFLYQLDVSGAEQMRELNSFLDEETKDSDVHTFATALVKGAWEGRESSDALITKIAKNWEIHRMAAVDRNVLRLAIYELRMPEAAPPKVVINEAIELGKRFSTQHSGKFINGILDKAKETMMASGEMSKARAQLDVDPENVETADDPSVVADEGNNSTDGGPGGAARAAD
jgi:N utilization substance protein B